MSSVVSSPPAAQPLLDGPPHFTLDRRGGDRRDFRRQLHRLPHPGRNRPIHFGPDRLIHFSRDHGGDARRDFTGQLVSLL
jgi:hypothetical protein